eukprot:CAMPEP_0171579746 /NCGR_PEP_ID=MMETSP0961-20121227/8639_1 /TAXON_ID=87120 /ORGANISM="Aurantiochytrium limacinum, Strain ATCCMYA-1381" /LENGTH=1142 /DNA_ID=CAMNT_0012136317 /DNA_START=212 /DNA_END=3640 /DNA_ORIENTATION=-
MSNTYANGPRPNNPNSSTYGQMNGQVQQPPRGYPGYSQQPQQHQMAQQGMPQQVSQQQQPPRPAQGYPQGIQQQSHPHPGGVQNPGYPSPQMAPRPQSQQPQAVQMPTQQMSNMSLGGRPTTPLQGYGQQQPQQQAPRPMQNGTARPLMSSGLPNQPAMLRQHVGQSNNMLQQQQPQQPPPQPGMQQTRGYPQQSQVPRPSNAVPQQQQMQHAPMGGALPPRGVISQQNMMQQPHQSAPFVSQAPGRGPPQTGGPGFPPSMQQAPPGRGPPMSMLPQQQQQQQQQQPMPPPMQVNMPARGPAPQQGPNSSNNSGPARRIDPAHMPRPSRTMERQEIYTRQFLGQGKKPLPRATDEFRALDDGNANPRYMRMTMQQFPATNSLLHMSQIPLACVMQPFAKLGYGEEEPQIVDLGTSGPTRCKRCRGYVNCFCAFDHSAGWWECNLCKIHNTLPPQYQGNYNSMYGSSQQPELSKGSVDFVVKGDYISRPLQEPILLFAVDVSTAARQTGTSGAVLRSIKKIVEEHVSKKARIVGDTHARIGILTYAQGVHFYDMYAPSTSGHKVLIVADADEGFCPLPPSRLVVNVDEKSSEIQGLVESLIQEYGDPIPPVPGQQHGQGPPNASVAGTAFQAAVHGLESCGGKVAFFVSQPPTFGVGTTSTRREDPQGYSTSRESGMYTIDTSREESIFSQSMGKCCEKQISIDIYSFGDDHKDLAQWGLASNVTGGELHRFPLIAAGDTISQAAFQQVLEHNVRRNAAVEAVLKVRVSTGMRVVEYYGNGLKRVRGGELDMAFIDEDNSSMVVLEHDGSNMDSIGEAYIQCAVLYTSTQGQRRVRVHNLAVSVTNIIADIFRNADVDAIANYLSRKAVDEMQRNTPINKVHADMNQKIVKMLCAYRKHCAKNPTGQQLILPEALKLLPLYAVSTQKLAALRQNLEGLKSHRSNVQSALVRADARVESFNLLQRLPLAVFLNFIYPAVYSFQLGDTVQSLPQKRNLPPSSTIFRDDEKGIILLCNGVDAFIYILQGTDPELIKLVTGHSTHAAALEASKQNTYQVDGLPFVAPPSSHPLIEALEAFLRRELAYPRASASSILGAIHVAIQGSVAERESLKYLVEDSLFSLKSMPAYDDFLCSIHQSIQVQMRN